MDYPFHHVYVNGYSVLPKLNKLGLDDPVFVLDQDYDHYINEKNKAYSDKRQCPLNRYKKMPPSVFPPISQFIRDKTGLTGKTITHLVGKIQEDIAIHYMKDDKEFLGYTNICFPSDWLPENKIGKSFSEIHKTVPGIKLDNSEMIVGAMINSGPFERWVWSPVYDKWGLHKINYHPVLPKEKFIKLNPRFHLKIERQVIWGFPEVNAALFVMRQHLVPFNQLDIGSLYHGCSRMTDKEKEYKGIEKPFIDWLYKKGRLGK